MQQHYSVSCPAVQPPFPFLAARIRPYLLLGKETSFNAHISLRTNHGFGTVSPFRAGGVFVGSQWDMACGCRGPCRVRRGPSRLVLAGCVVKGDGWGEDCV